MIRQAGVAQTLFIENDPATGTRFEFIFLEDGRCGLARDGVVEQTWPDDEDGVTAGIDAFRAACDAQLRLPHPAATPAPALVSA